MASGTVRDTLAPSKPAVLSAVQRFFLEMCALDVVYAGPNGSTRRRVDPHYILLSWPAWYLVTWDELRAACRTFRLDRILAATVTARTFRLRPVETMMTQASKLFHSI